MSTIRTLKAAVIAAVTAATIVAVAWSASPGGAGEARGETLYPATEAVRHTLIEHGGPGEFAHHWLCVAYSPPNPDFPASYTAVVTVGGAEAYRADLVSGSARPDCRDLDVYGLAVPAVVEVKGVPAGDGTSPYGTSLYPLVVSERASG